MSLAALILAAGASRRMGRPKALLDLNGETFLDRLIGAFSATCSPVIVVLGHGAETIRDGLRRGEAALFVHNPDHHLGQLSSLQRGLSAVPPEAVGVLFTPVDYPAAKPSTVSAIAERFGQRTANELLVIARCQGRHGHPVAIASELIPELLALPSGAQARDVIRRHRSHTAYVDVEDPGILEDTDDPEAYERLRRATAARP